MLYKGEVLVIPGSLHKHMLSWIHAGHAGIVHSKYLGRESCYWPGLATDIKKMVLECEICARFKPTNPGHLVPIMAYSFEAE